MGAQQTKEEVIIAQAGNSGGSTNQGKSSNFSASEVLGIVAFSVIIILVIVFVFRVCKKRLERKIRLEVARSSMNISHLSSREKV